MADRPPRRRPPCAATRRRPNTSRRRPTAARPSPTPAPPPAALAAGRYVLSLAVQVLFWFLIFMAIAVAVGAGGHLTEFRYVGFYDAARTCGQRRRQPARARRGRSGAAVLLTEGRTSLLRVRRPGGQPRCRLADGRPGRGDRVATLLEEYDDFFVAMFAAWLAGGRAGAPQHEPARQPDVAWLLAKSRPRVLLAEDDPPAGDGAADATGAVAGAPARGRRGPGPPARGGRRARRAAAALRRDRRGPRRARHDHVHVGHDGRAQGRLSHAARRSAATRPAWPACWAWAPTTASSSTRRPTSRAASATSSRSWPTAAARSGVAASFLATPCWPSWPKPAAPASAAPRRTLCASSSRSATRCRRRRRCASG